MEKKYAIVLKSQMGPKPGFININIIGHNLEGTMECLGKLNGLEGIVNDDDSLVLEGVLDTPIGKQPFKIVAEIKDDQFSGEFISKNRRYENQGIKQPD